MLSRRYGEQPAGSTGERPRRRVVTMAILDGYTVEPSGLGVPPWSDDFRWLAQMRDRLDRAGSHFMGGLVLHTGQRRLPFGDRLMALPVSDLWN